MESIKAIVLIDLYGKRVLARYFDEKIKDKQFDKKIWHKTIADKRRDRILTVDGYVVVHHLTNDLHMYVVGGRNDNPLILDQILNCLVEVVATLLTRSEQRSVHEIIDQLIIALDEICDSGMLLETDPNIVIDRVSLKPEYVTPRFGFPWVN